MHLILIIYDDLREYREKLKPEVRAYVKTHTYLQWGDKWFWEKLEYALKE